ncbi:MAG TPA: M20/M25/M40 family metallo-hydrolase [Ohtaekwangia sp.]|uniref:M20/M25/M40 family metallo-hydrolase n=1 Tax=Ohtaekwangia sp. TaxID=2066019 RepID=UPI002F931B59
MKRLIQYLPAALVVLAPVFGSAQQVEKIDTAMVSKIKDEGLNHSKVMDILSMLTDVHGPRLTNSPGYKKAANYAKSSLELWGVQNVHLDTWEEDFGRGWQLKKFSLQNLSPVYFPVIAYPKAWSPGIKGTVEAEVVYLDIKKEEDINKYKGKLKGKIVLFSLPTLVKPGFKPDATRLNDSTLLQMANADISESFGGRRFQAPTEPQRLAYLKWDLCQKEGAIAVIEASPATRLEDGTLTVSAATVPYPAETPFSKRVSAYKADVPKILPQVVVAAEHYNRMIRQIEKGQTVKLELTLETEFTPSAPGFNVIGEIPGTDLKDEVVMFGAHLDSWHSGTGTTDNAAGSAVMLEAMRILKALGVTPRRTIRIGLWGGEEQGLLGSRSYVKRTYGERLDKSFPYDSIQLKPGAEKFSVYLNMDNGTGRFRGVYLQGNENVRPIFRSWLKPFNKMGASTLTLQNTGGTDHLSFDAIGLPGFQFIQDPIEYSSRTHHTSMDLYDKAIEADLKQNATMIAAFAWLAANRDSLIPRK